jgi:type IX secretion system PorP/SprF family membrane protein
MIRHLFLIFSFCYVCVFVNAQDPIYSQFYSAPLQINPAFAGNTYAPHIAINYRNQWPSIPNAYTTYSVAYDQFSPSLNIGYGLSILGDEAGNGLISSNKVSGFFAYRVQVDRDFFLKLGVEASGVQSRYNWSKFVFFDQLDPRFGSTTPGGSPIPSEEVPPENLNNTYFDISTGILAYSKMFYGGISLKHLNTPNESLLGINDNLNTGLPMRFTIHGGMEIKLREGNKRKSAAFISPNIMFIKQGDFGQINGGAYGSLGAVFAGIWYRHAFTTPDAAIFLIGVQKGIFKIGYSYDVTVSGLSAETGGSHELSLILNFERDRGVDYSDCFQLFR